MEMPLKTKILEPQNINEATIKTILDNGALEHYDNGGLYVTTDVTPNYHPVLIRASALLLPKWAGEARGCVA